MKLQMQCGSFVACGDKYFSPWTVLHFHVTVEFSSRRDRESGENTKVCLSLTMNYTFTDARH